MKSYTPRRADLKSAHLLCAEDDRRDIVTCSQAREGFNANGNRGIAAGLTNIQFWEDGEPLNGRIRAEDEFDSLDAEDDEDFLD